MKKPEDKLESLYQEKLDDSEQAVSDRVWQRVNDRTGGKRRRKGFSWWVLGAFILATSITAAIYFQDEEAVKEGQESSSLAQNAGDKDLGSKTASPDGSDQEEKAGNVGHRGAKPSPNTGGGNGNEGKGADNGPSKEENGDALSSGKAPLEEEKGPDGEQEQQARSKGTERDKDRPKQSGQEEMRDPDPQARGEKGDAIAEDASGGTPENEDRNEGVREEKKAAASEEESGKGDRKKEADQSSPTGNTDQKEKSEKLSEKKGNEEESKGRTITDSSKERSKETPSSGTEEVRSETPSEEKASKALSLLDKSFQSPEAPDTGAIHPIGKQPEKIELSKGSQAVKSYYIRGIASYGPRYRALESTHGSGLAEHRDGYEAPTNGFDYGIETGVRWENGFGAGIGVQRRNYGSEFAFSDSKTLTDSSFSTDTNTTYIDSTWYTYDSMGNPIDTHTVTIDTVNNYDEDTTVTQQDSSYKHRYSIRYRYITVPLHVSYRFRLSDRLAVVPTVGLGLNFLTRANTGWTRPESHEKVRYRYPSKDPPFKRFALSLRGRLALRYEFARSWQVGVGFRYSRFIQNIYKDDIGLREYPYSYGGSFSVSYMLRDF